MAKNLGMTPATVAEQARSMHSHMSVLDSIISDIAHAGEASRWPGPFGLLPGNKIMTEGSILLSENAATDVQLAVDAAAELLERLQVSIGEQNEASAAGDGYHDGTTSKRNADDLYLRAMNDPTALEGMTPAQVNAWWNRLSKQQQDDFVARNPQAAGNTNGIPFANRVEANRLNAEQLLSSGTNLSKNQREYLEKVAAGDKSLISFDPKNDRIIEMIGDLGPNTTNIVNYVPGTGTTMDSIYGEGPQGMAHALVDGAIPPGSTVAFVYKDAPFPGWGANDGVYHSSSAARAGGPYHDFNSALALENSNGASVTSVEHSFGSSVGGYAETQGTHFDKRVVLGGIGMTDDWKPSSGTDYYSYTGDHDIIRAARGKGSEDTNTGYEIPPTSENGFIELDPDIHDLSPIDQHTHVASPDNNQVVVDGILEIIRQ